MAKQVDITEENRENRLCFLTCRGTPWCPWPCPPCSSAGQRTRPQVWHINQDAIFDRHSMVMVPGLWDSNENFFHIRMLWMTFTSSIPPWDGKKNQFDLLALVFIYILTYLEEKLARRCWERLLRATSTSAICTVSLYKKVLIKTSLRWGVPSDPGSSNFHQRLPSYKGLIPVNFSWALHFLILIIKWRKILDYNFYDHEQCESCKHKVFLQPLQLHRWGRIGITFVQLGTKAEH